VADKQVILKAAIEIPPGLDEPLFYLSTLHYFLLLSLSLFLGAEVLCHLCSFKGRALTQRFHPFYVFRVRLPRLLVAEKTLISRQPAPLAPLSGGERPHRYQDARSNQRNRYSAPQRQNGYRVSDARADHNSGCRDQPQRRAKGEIDLAKKDIP
jgi:hypothetical protein